MPVSVQKAMEQARRGMFKVALKNGTLHHTVVGKHGAATVLISPAAEGTGVIAGGPMRAIFEVMGVRNVVARAWARATLQHGSRHVEWPARLLTPADVAAKRGKTVEEILG